MEVEHVADEQDERGDGAEAGEVFRKGRLGDRKWDEAAIVLGLKATLAHDAVASECICVHVDGTRISSSQCLCSLHLELLEAL